MFIHHVAHYLPETVVPNSYFTEINGLTDEWIQGRTGIRERRKASGTENTNTMALAALENLLPGLGFDPADFDLIVGATYTPYDTIATLAHTAQNRLGIAPIPVISISTACSSFLNAMEIVQGYFAMGKASKALVLVADHNTAYSNEHDQKAGHLWGDGAAAVAVVKEKVKETDFQILDIRTAGAGSVGKAMEGVVLRPLDGGCLMPNGRDVFLYACQYMAQVTKEIVSDNGLTLEQVDYLIPHQANQRISLNVTESLGLPLEKLISNIPYLGNTGCAGCAIALSENHTRFLPGQHVVITVFGGGYSYGSMLLRT